MNPNEPTLKDTCPSARKNEPLFAWIHDEILEGTFYAEELWTVMKKDDVYKIDQIFKKEEKKDDYNIF